MGELSGRQVILLEKLPMKYKQLSPILFTGVEKQILELLRKGEYDKVFAKANHVENVSAKLSGM